MNTKNTLLVFVFLCLITSLGAQDLVIKEVLYNPAEGNDKMLVCNNSAATIDISTYRLCARFSYPRFNDSRFTILSGDLNLAVGDCVAIDLGTWNLNDVSSDLGIYLPTGSFGSAAAMIDFVQWGTANIGREGVAVSKGIWSDNTFVVSAPAGMSMQFDCTNGGGGELTLTSDFAVTAPTTDLCPPAATPLQVKVILQGPFNGTDMDTDLQTNMQLPMTDPYGQGETVTSIPANVVDWVKVELRDPTDNTTVIATRACFLRNDGQVLELDGSINILFEGLSVSSAYVAVLHRNHLGVMTNASVSF